MQNVSYSILARSLRLFSQREWALAVLGVPRSTTLATRYGMHRRARWRRSSLLSLLFDGGESSLTSSLHIDFSVPREPRALGPKGAPCSSAMRPTYIQSSALVFLDSGLYTRDEVHGLPEPYDSTWSQGSQCQNSICKEDERAWRVSVWRCGPGVSILIFSSLEALKPIMALLVPLGLPLLQIRTGRCIAVQMPKRDVFMSSGIRWSSKRSRCLSSSDGAIISSFRH
ncbi:hypothetical protein M432DRAFT_180134 [Thermoascus aurantiacus ATCC 26904]